jgi:tRNA G18 (ribose-2'-O)-methylase SpoU
MDRVPFQATTASVPYDHIRRLPVAVLLDNVRSLYNVGAFFRTADAAGVERLHLCGITGRPPKPGIAKTALGAEDSVPWEHTWEPVPLIDAMRRRGYEIAAVETTVHAVDLYDWTPRFPVCAIFGHEVEGGPRRRRVRVSSRFRRGSGNDGIAPGCRAAGRRRWR